MAETWGVKRWGGIEPIGVPLEGIRVDGLLYHECKVKGGLFVWGQGDPDRLTAAQRRFIGVGDGPNSEQLRFEAIDLPGWGSHEVEPWERTAPDRNTLKAFRRGEMSEELGQST
jgi:hypothetical protein